MKAVLYARVSTKEQAEEGFSLDSQVKLLRDYAGKHNFTIVREFTVPESASGKDLRKTFNGMLEFVGKRSDVKVMLFEKVDRATRNFRESLFLNDWIDKDAERQLHFVKQNLVIHQNSKSYEAFQWDIYVVIAKNYSRNLSEEIKKDWQRSWRKGGYPQSRRWAT